MKLIRFLQIIVQIMLAQLVFFAHDENGTQNDISEPGPLIPTDKTKEKKDPKFYARILAYVLVTSALMIFVPWTLWRIIRNWGSWKIHTPSPRPQYIRTPSGWVDIDTWQLKQVKKAKRKAAERYKHKVFYRTTRANYNWIFHDPTGELQQRFNDQREQSYLRFLPSWMRSYPHGTLQSDILPQQPIVPKDACELPNLDFNGNSCRSSTHGNAQLDGVSTPGAFSNPDSLLSIWDMDYCNAIKPSTAGKSRLPPALPMIEELDAIQVWHVRANPLPERTDPSHLESEEELRGEVESPEESMRRDTERRLGIGLALLMSRQDPHVETQIEGLERRMLDLAGSIEAVEDERSLLLTRGTLDTLVRELHGTSRDRRVRRPIPQNARESNILQQIFADIAIFERVIHDLPFVATEPPLRNTLATGPDWGILVRVGLPVLRPDTRAVVYPAQMIARLATDDFWAHLPNLWNPSDALGVHVFPTATDAFNAPYQGLIATWVNASSPITVAPQTDGVADGAVIEELGSDDDTGPDSMSVGISEGTSSVVSTEGPIVEESSDADSASEEDLQPDTQNPIAAALLRSVPDDDADLEQADAAAHGSEEDVGAEAVRLTAAFYNEMGNPDPIPDGHVQEAEAGDDAAPVNVGGQYPSTASEPHLSGTAAQGTATAAPYSLDEDDGFVEEFDGDD